MTTLDQIAEMAANTIAKREEYKINEALEAGVVKQRLEDAKQANLMLESNHGVEWKETTMADLRAVGCEI